jgi:nitroimidazol reductase NimA-like FMN-containing flavoprotein (pyridoxamine 5'-phosphate oxidase superfamily)
MSFVPTDKIGSLTDDELALFLAEPWNARIATVTPDGWPYVTPVWYEFEPPSRSFVVVGRERAAWVAHIRHNPRVGFHVADDLHTQHTRVLAQATAEILEGPIAPARSPRLLDLTHRLSRRYLGPDGAVYAERTLSRPRVLVRLAPTSWMTWTGREWHPRYR